MKPLAIDLYCGLGGWTDGLLAEGWDVIGFDIERHVYGQHRYPAQLVIQDVRTLHGSQFRDALLIVASPPCQEYSWMAMPWSRGKQVAAALRGEAEFPPNYSGSRTIQQLTALFDACFRIQREACAAAGRHIPLVVENVKGAQRWVGPAQANFGSFYVWGDVPAPQMELLPGLGVRQRLSHASKNSGGSWFAVAHNRVSGCAHNARDDLVRGGHKSSGLNWSDPSRRGQDFTRVAGRQAGEGVKQHGSGRAWFDKALDKRRPAAPGAIKVCGGADGWFGAHKDHPLRVGSSGSTKRKAASALIAKIPEPLSRHIARAFWPDQSAREAA